MLENVNGCSYHNSRLRKKVPKMIKIDIESAYDDFTQFTLFDNELKSSIADAEDEPSEGYVMDLSNDKPGKDYKPKYGVKSFIDFAQAVRKLYIDAWEQNVDEIKQPLNFYTTIRYNEMLRDDIINGYVTPLKTEDDYYVIVLAPEADGNANILAHRKLFEPELRF